MMRAKRSSARSSTACPHSCRKTPESVENLFRRTVEVATGRHHERRLTQAFAPSAELTADLANELQRLAGATPKLPDGCWNFLEGLAETLLTDSLGRERAIETILFSRGLMVFAKNATTFSISSTKSAPRISTGRVPERPISNRRKRLKFDRLSNDSDEKIP